LCFSKKSACSHCIDIDLKTAENFGRLGND
jgi:hypothetical protein